MEVIDTRAEGKPDAIPLPFMVATREGHAAVAMDEHLWVIGGHTFEALDTVWSFDTVRQHWFKMPNLPKPIETAYGRACVF